MNYKGVHIGLCLTLISRHKSILIRGEITDFAECRSALLHEHLSVRIKTRLERHLLLNSRLIIDSREISMYRPSPTNRHERVF